MLVGLLAPLLIIVSTLLGTMVADYTTCGRVSLHDLIPYILYPAKVIKGETHNYWVIVDTFYFGTKKRTEQNTDRWHPAHSKSLVTLILALATSVTVLEAFLTFAGQAVSVMEAFSSCEDAGDIKYTFTCYSGETWQRINCLLNNSSSHIFCFSFIPVSSLSDAVLGSAVAGALVYVGFVALFKLTFKIAGVLLRCRITKVFGATVLLIGIIIFLCGFVQGFVIFKYPVNFKPPEAIQVFLFGIYVILMGLLLLRAKWCEKADKKEEITLVSISSPKARQLGNCSAQATRGAHFNLQSEGTSDHGSTSATQTMPHQERHIMIMQRTANLDLEEAFDA